MAELNLNLTSESELAITYELFEIATRRMPQPDILRYALLMFLNAHMRENEDTHMVSPVWTDSSKKLQAGFNSIVSNMLNHLKPTQLGPLGMLDIAGLNGGD